MTSPQKMELGLYDYESMFKRHVHDNLVLNDDLRLLDSMKKSKLRELNRSKAAFKKRLLPKTSYSKQRGTLPDIHFCRNETPRPFPKPSYVVCKDSPGSFKTWGNLTDVAGAGIDVYKKEVLQSSESPVSFRKNKTATENTTKVDEQGAKTTIDALNKPSQKSYNRRLSKSPRLGSREADKENHDTFLSEFRNRSATMPEFSLRPKLPILGKSSNVDSPLRPRADTYEGVDANNSPRENGRNVSNTTKSVKIDVNIIPPTEENSLSNIDNDNYDSSRRKIQRAKSFSFVHVKQNDHSDANTNTFRSRSNTMGSERLLKRRGTINVSDLHSAAGLRRMSLANRLLALSKSSLSADTGSEDEFRGSYESLGSCRYLRIPGENIYGSQEDISLENLNLDDEDTRCSK